MIYFIAPPDGSRIKIGTTIRLAERLQQLRLELGEEFRVLAIVDGDRGEEQALHSRFAALRLVDEWFEPGEDLLGFIVAEGREWTPADDHARPRYGTLVRVSDEFAEALRNASSFEKMSIAEFSNAYLLPLVSKRYREAVLREARKMEGKDK